MKILEYAFELLFTGIVYLNLFRIFWTALLALSF